MPYRLALVSPSLVNAIEDGISKVAASQFEPQWTAGGKKTDPWLVIKYIPTKYCRDFRPNIIPAGGPSPRLRISDSPGFTWGTGNYVVPLAYPVSTAIYGRAGVVATLDQNQTRRWRIFDARLPANQNLYVQWSIAQPAFRWLTLTCHANLANQFLRNAFREAFRIDCVVFHPDQRNAYYTKTNDDWMCISDWNRYNRLARGSSAVLQTPRLAILVSEEFTPIGADVRRRTMIGPLSAMPTNAALASAIRNAATSGTIVELTA